MITGFCYSQMIATDVIYLVENYEFAEINADDINVETIILTDDSNISGEITSGATVGGAALAVVVNHVGATNQTVATFTNYLLVITDSEGQGGHGGLKLLDFPAGMIDIYGVIGDIAFTAGVGVTTTATYDFGIGTETFATDNAALSAAEQDIVTKVEGDLTASAVDADFVNVTLANFDGHTTADDVWFNVVFEDNDMTATGTITVNGTIVITWANLGDY